MEFWAVYKTEDSYIRVGNGSDKAAAANNALETLNKKFGEDDEKIESICEKLVYEKRGYWNRRKDKPWQYWDEEK